MLYGVTCDWLEQPKSLFFLLGLMHLYLDWRVLGLNVEGLRMFSDCWMVVFSICVCFVRRVQIWRKMLKVE